MNGNDFGQLEMLGSSGVGNKANADHLKNAECTLFMEGQYGAVYRRIKRLVDPGTFLPLGSLFDPEHNSEETTGVITGLAKVRGTCVCVIASNPEIRKGAWLPGQPQKILRMQRLAELLRAPIFFLLECSGLDLEQQHKVYTGHLSGGRTFFNNARLATKGVPIIEGIFGTNVAGGGYGGISATKRFAHKDASMAIGGAAIMSGMRSSKNGFTEKDIDMLLEEVSKCSVIPSPGSIAVHTETGFFDGVFENERQVIDAMRACIPEGDASVPRCQWWDVPDLPRHDADDLYHLLPYDPSRMYDINEVLARIIDGSRAHEYMPEYGPEVYCGHAHIDGCAVGIVANRQGFLPNGYPEYADYPGIGGKLYRQGLVKMCRFVSWCDTHKVPMIWFQDTSGIDVGDQAERAGLLGLGQALIYSIENAKIPMMTFVLRKGHAASHYVMCGPQASPNALTLGTALTEIMVMHRESAAMARYGRALEKACPADRPSVIRQMNELVEKYRETSSPRYAAVHGLVDEVISLARMRDYLSWFAHAAYTSLEVSQAPVQGLWTLWPDIVEKSYLASKLK